jgi:hypothetical protein
MILKGCVWIIVPLMMLPSRTSIYYLGLMIYLINSMVCVCSLRLIFDWVIISWRFESATYRRLYSFWGMACTSSRWCHLDWLMHQPTLCIWWTRFSWSIWTSLSWCSSMIYLSTQEVKKSMKGIFVWFYRSFKIISYMPSWARVSSGWNKLLSKDMSSRREAYP